jgi:hypothetical protein
MIDHQHRQAEFGNGADRCVHHGGGGFRIERGGVFVQK